MKTPFPHFLARLSGVPLLIAKPHLAALSVLALATPKHDLGDDDLDGDAPDYVPPWEAREQVTIYPGGVAVIPVDGMLAKGFDPLLAWLYDFWRVEAVEAAIALCASRGDITAVVFNFNCPGGYTTGIPELAAQIDQLEQTKPTFAFTGTLCASAAYWLASQCAAIICTPSSTVGSIGTYAAWYDYSEYLKKQGIELKLFRAGDMKGMHALGHVLTPDEEAFIQSSIDAINAGFIAAVKTGRGDLADADLQGQWFTGAAAVGKNLADSTVLTFGELLESIGASQPKSVLPPPAP